MEIGTARCSLDKQVSSFLGNSATFNPANVRKFPCRVDWNLRSYKRVARSRGAFTEKYRMGHLFRRVCLNSIPVSLEESSSLESNDYAEHLDDVSEDSPKEILSQPLSSDQLQALLADSERDRLIKKLSEANQHNRFLKRQLYTKEDALVNFKSELAVMELEIQALVSLAEEVAKSGIPAGSRKINGRFIQSHLLSRLEAVHEKLKEQIKGVGAAQSKEVPLFWFGVAESVQVMGSFDGWIQGEHLSPEYNGSYTKFSTTLMLRPGRYEIKFLVDGDWQLSPEFPKAGEGLMENNLLIVE